MRYARVVSTRTMWLLAVLFLGATLFAVALWAFPPHHAESTETIVSNVPTLPIPPPRTVMDASSLFDALVFVKPRFGQHALGKHSAGSDLLAQWASVHLRWSDVSANHDETNYGLALRDIEAARGKRLCFSGTVVQIKVDRAGPAPFFDGIIQSDASHPVAFAAVKSVGSIAVESYARLCAIVVDTYEYQSRGLGELTGLDVVGMFDLPENKPPSALARSAPTFEAPDCEAPFVTGPDGKLALKPGCDKP